MQYNESEEEEEIEENEFAASASHGLRRTRQKPNFLQQQIDIDKELEQMGKVSAFYYFAAFFGYIPFLKVVTIEQRLTIRC